jgi:hypothetical protein
MHSVIEVVQEKIYLDPTELHICRISGSLPIFRYISWFDGRLGDFPLFHSHDNIGTLHLKEQSVYIYDPAGSIKNRIELLQGTIDI